MRLWNVRCVHYRYSIFLKLQTHCPTVKQSKAIKSTSNTVFWPTLHAQSSSTNAALNFHNLNQARGTNHDRPPLPFTRTSRPLEEETPEKQNVRRANHSSSPQSCSPPSAATKSASSQPHPHVSTSSRAVSLDSSADTVPVLRSMGDGNSSAAWRRGTVPEALPLSPVAGDRFEQVAATRYSMRSSVLPAYTELL